MKYVQEIVNIASVVVNVSNVTLDTGSKDWVKAQQVSVNNATVHAKHVKMDQRNALHVLTSTTYKIHLVSRLTMLN